jgi:hypothetical protein
MNKYVEDDRIAISEFERAKTSNGNNHWGSAIGCFSTGMDIAAFIKPMPKICTASIAFIHQRVRAMKKAFVVREGDAVKFNKDVMVSKVGAAIASSEK